MPIRRLARCVVILLAIAAVGCAHGRGASNGAQCCAVAPPAVEDALPEITPQGFDFDISQIGAPGDVDRALGRPFPPAARYYSLSAEACQCLAVEHSTQGNSLAAERRSVQARASKHHGLGEEDRLRVRALRATEREARNKSAAAALELYYLLAEDEANLSIVEASLTEIDGALAKVQRLHKQGVQIPFDDSELARRRIDLVEKLTDLHLKARQLNAQLARLIGFQTIDPNARIWPATDWQVVAAPIDMDAEVQEGLSQRPELQFLYSLPAALNENTVGVVREIVAGAGGLISSQSKSAGLAAVLGLGNLCGKRKAKERELPVRRRQVAEFTQQRRLEITSDIQQAVYEIEAGLRQIAIAKQRMQSWDQRLAELRAKQKIEEATFVDLSAAQLSALEAHSEETHRIVGWKVAQVELKEAQGLLVLECESGRVHCPPGARVASNRPTPPQSSAFGSMHPCSPSPSPLPPITTARAPQLNSPR